VDVFDRSSGATRRENERADPGNADHVAAPLPGVLVAVRVKEGQSVRKDEPLCTLEAMKMETTVLAPHPGVVERIALAEGASTRPGDLLLCVTGRGG
jgi:pyruvate carboxylase